MGTSGVGVETGRAGAAASGTLGTGLGGAGAALGTSSGGMGKGRGGAAAGGTLGTGLGGAGAALGTSTGGMGEGRGGAAAGGTLGTGLGGAGAALGTCTGGMGESRGEAAAGGTLGTGLGGAGAALGTSGAGTETGGVSLGAAGMMRLRLRFEYSRRGSLFEWCATILAELGLQVERPFAEAADRLGRRRGRSALGCLHRFCSFWLRRRGWRSLLQAYAALKAKDHISGQIRIAVRTGSHGRCQL